MIGAGAVYTAIVSGVAHTTIISRTRHTNSTSAVYITGTCSVNDADRTFTPTANTASICTLITTNTVIPALGYHRYHGTKQRGVLTAPQRPKAELHRLALNDELFLPPQLAGPTRSATRWGHKRTRKGCKQQRTSPQRFWWSSEKFSQA